MIQFQSVRLAHGARILIDQLSMQLHPGWKIGLTGANGCGKSSLFALLRGQIGTDSGTLLLPDSWSIAHVAQETPASPQSALDYAIDGDAELRAIEIALQDAETAHHGEKIGELHARLGEIEGYAAPARAAALLNGLGFSENDMQRPVADFSGGWRMRLNLAQALMCRSDLLLLDEPTNHLDLDTVIWLEQWLNSYQGTLILISHDREFLDSCVGHIAHIEQQRLSLYSGNYSDFEAQRAARLAHQQALYDKQQREIAHMESFVRRFQAKATKARQAQSRIKALQRMEKIAAAHVDSPFSFQFKPCPAAPDPLIHLEQGALGYTTDQLILQNISLTLRPGERIGLLGRNGAGKSTLIKHLSSNLPLISGKRVDGKGLAIGYFAQHQLEVLRPDESPLQHLQRLSPDSREQDLRNYLGQFNFSSDTLGTHASNGALTPCQHFSGGEKARLALALLIWQKPNLLLLDEPTNHLDLDMRHALMFALQQFEGSVVVVSHDRALLRSVCDQFLLVDQGQVRIFDGDLEDYRSWLATQRAADIQRLSASSDKAARKASRQENAQRVAQTRQLKKEHDRLEQKMQRWEEEKNQLEQRLAAPDLYNDSDTGQLQALLKQQADLQKNLEQAEERWLEIEEALSTVENDT